MGVAESELPAAVVMMRAADLAEQQEQMLRKSAELSNEDRFAQGLVVGRGQAAKSVEYLLQNTKLAKLPGCTEPAAQLRSIALTVSKGDGPLTSVELLQLAARYQLAGQQIRAALDKLPEAQRSAGAEAFAALRAADDEVKQPFWSEDGRFASGQMGVAGGKGAELDAATRQERAAYLEGTMDEARERLREQRLQRADAKAESRLYGQKSNKR